MKDAYSFDVDEAGARRAYNQMFVAYLRTFARMGLKAIPMRAETGPIGGDLSHEFLVLAETGESGVYCDSDILDAAGAGRGRRLRRRPAAADRAVDHVSTPPPKTCTRSSGSSARCRAERQLATRGIEVGQIFYFGTKYSEPMKADRGRAGRGRAAGPHGLLRHRRLAAGRRDHRGEPRRGRDHLAGQRRAVRGRPDQPQGRRRRGGRGGRRALRASQECRNFSALRRPRRAGRGEVRDHGPDRPAVAGDRRPKGLERGEVEIKRRATGARETLGLDDGLVDRLAAGARRAEASGHQGNRRHAARSPASSG